MIKSILKYCIPRLLFGRKLTFNQVWNLQKQDVDMQYVRVHKSLILSDKNPKGVFQSGEPVTLINTANGKFSMGFIQGQGINYKMLFKTCFVVDFKTRSQLGIDKNTRNAQVEIRPASGIARYYSQAFISGRPEQRMNYRSSYVFGFVCVALGSILGLLLPPIFT